MASLTAQNIIEVGKRLIQAKSLVNHGHWQDWLENNFSLSRMTANNFMNCAEKFADVKSILQFKPTQMIALLSLPDAAETEKFIAEKAAEGKKVDEMTIKQLREEIADYKSKLDEAKKDYQQSLFDLKNEHDQHLSKVQKQLGEQLTDLKDKYDGQIADLKQELNDPKSLVNHGHWQAWLEQNFQLSQQTARKFMECAERFGKTLDVERFKPSQLTEMLALPDAEETEKFIAEKAAEGKKSR